MPLLLLALACSLPSAPASPGSPAAASLEQQLSAQEHARKVTELMEEMEQGLNNPSLTPKELIELRATLERAKLEAQAAQEALDRAEAELAQP